MRKTQFVNNEYYHVFNRGVDKREIFSDYDDLSRFFQSMNEFNTINPIGSIFENSFRKLEKSILNEERLVNFVCYCLNPNHFHFILKQIAGKGVEKFMHRLGVGYTKYFNKKYNRMGSLLQGSYKSVRVDSNEYLLHLSVYINLNDKVHQLGNLASKSLSSWNEYLNLKEKGFCEKEIVLEQFNNANEYKLFAEDVLENIKERKELEKLLLE